LAEKLGKRREPYRDRGKEKSVFRQRTRNGKPVAPIGVKGAYMSSSPRKRDAFIGYDEVSGKRMYAPMEAWDAYKKKRSSAIKFNIAKRRDSSLLAAQRQSRMRQDQARTQAARGKRAAYASLLSGYDSGGIG